MDQKEIKANEFEIEKNFLRPFVLLFSEEESSKNKNIIGQTLSKEVYDYIYGTPLRASLINFFDIYDIEDPFDNLTEEDLDYLFLEICN